MSCPSKFSISVPFRVPFDNIGAATGLLPGAQPRKDLYENLG